MSPPPTSLVDLLWELIPLLALPILLVLAAWGVWHQRRPRSGDAFPDVPDAPTGATPTEAPGMTYPYSSLDPYAPPKKPVDWSGKD